MFGGLCFISALFQGPFYCFNNLVNFLLSVHVIVLSTVLADTGVHGAELPLHVNELKDIQPQLSALVTVYGIDAVRF
jgi:hypothetical protein